MELKMLDNVNVYIDDGYFVWLIMDIIGSSDYL